MFATAGFLKHSSDFAKISTKSGFSFYMVLHWLKDFFSGEIVQYIIEKCIKLKRFTFCRFWAVTQDLNTT